MIVSDELMMYAGIEMFNKLLDYAEAGENVGILLRNIKRDDVTRGDVLCKPGSVAASTKFECKVYLLTEDEGGRKKPFASNYKYVSPPFSYISLSYFPYFISSCLFLVLIIVIRPQFFIRTADITGKIELKGAQMGMPGDNIEMNVELIHPAAIFDGLRFAIREGQLTIGAGVITKVLG